MLTPKQEYNKEYRKRNKEILDAQRKEWAHSNKEKQHEYHRRYRENDPIAYYIRTKRAESKKKGLEFRLTKEDLVIPEVCPVFKTPFLKGTKFAMSIDRIDNTKGYIPNNIQIMSRLANTMKNEATPEQLIQFANWIYKEYT